MHRILTRLLVCAAVCTVALPTMASDAWPTKPIRIIVPFSAGGSADAIARLVADKMSPAFGQPVLVENRPGAAAIVGTQMAARAPADGYTLLAATNGPIAVNPALYSKLPYSVSTELAPISMVASFPLILVVKAGDERLRTLQNLVTFTSEHPEKSNYGSSATSTRLAVELMKSKSGIKAMHIPFRGSIDANNAVVSGEVTMSLSDVPTAAGLIAGNRLHGVAVTTEQRLKAFPDVPTLKEQGVDVVMKIWVGLFAPAGTPPRIIERISAEVERITKLADVRTRLAGMHAEPEGSTSAAFADTVATESKVWAEVAKANDIRAD